MMLLDMHSPPNTQIWDTIAGPIPKELAGLIHLKKLNLRENQLTGDMSHEDIVKY